jgi:hypothetical protein
LLIIHRYEEGKKFFRSLLGLLTQDSQLAKTLAEHA